MSKHLLSYGDCLLDPSDLALLQDAQWINDKLIDFSFEHLQNTLALPPDILLCCAEVVQLVKMSSDPKDLILILEGLDMLSRKWILFPINNNESLVETGGSHWSLLVYEASSKLFHHFDSLNQINYEAAVQLALQLEGVLQRKISKHNIQQAASPTQVNGYDCGMYVIEMANILAVELKKGSTISECISRIVDITAEEIKAARYHTANTIVKLAEEAAEIA